MPSSNDYRINLKAGQLVIQTCATRIALRRLLGFGSRINSKRGYSLVSKVVGKHCPVSPKMMAWSYRALVKRLLTTCPELQQQTSLWIGMAEIATGLGYGVFQSAYQQGLGPALWQQTTRYRLKNLQRLAFVETHSHAADFFLYYPTDEDKRARFLQAEHLILIDDEISTGATFSRLITAYRAENPQLKQISIVSLVNFAGHEARAKLEAEAQLPVQWLSLLEGELQFEPNPGQDLYQDAGINVIGNGGDKLPLLGWAGRLGITEPFQLHDDILTPALALLPPPEQSRQRPLLVLGSGECNPPAYLLGRALEAHGFNVRIQATSRSPVRLDGIIQSRLRFTDNYQDEIDNFLYNVNPDDYCQIIVCHETPVGAKRRKTVSSQPSFNQFMRQLNVLAAYCTSTDAPYADICFYRP